MTRFALSRALGAACALLHVLEQEVPASSVQLRHAMAQLVSECEHLNTDRDGWILLALVGQRVNDLVQNTQAQTADALWRFVYRALLNLIARLCVLLDIERRALGGSSRAVKC